jgi:GDPmannose 4,6-dehydratase
MRALITGITGQDGSYLAELLLREGVEVHGIVRRSSTISTDRIDHIIDKLHLHHGDVTDFPCVSRIVRDVCPHRVFNLAGQSHVRVSFATPEYTLASVGLGTLNVLEACRQLRDVRIYQASSSEMFGNEPAPQSETTPFRPRSPYGAAKAYAHNIAVNYRESYGMHVSCGILFNHESPRRGETFVTSKIARAVAAIIDGKQNKLHLGNMEARRDWGFAGDYVEAMWLMSQQSAPDDYVIATGETHSVREFCELAFSKVGLDYRQYVVEGDPQYLRPAEVDILLGDPSKAREAIGWKPKVTFDDLVRMMVSEELRK